MVLVKSWILCKPFEGDAKKENFELMKEEIEPILEDGDVFVEAVYLSVDPYMRLKEKMKAIFSMKEIIESRLFADPAGKVLSGEQVARVLQSKNPKFPVGTEVLAKVGWRTHTLIKDTSGLRKLPQHGDMPSSVTLGVLGMPGATAYLGYHDVMRAKSGETVVISTASGAVGSIVGQIAKIQGCKVIGFAGRKEKCDWLKNDLKFDHVFNYKETDVDTAINQAAPNGVDCYWDNVGGDFTFKMIGHMAKNGRVIICGNISLYNTISDKHPSGPYPYLQCLTKTLRIEGFVLSDIDYDKWIKSFEEIYKWIKEGKLQYREAVTDGFENMVDAFLGLFKGSNFGKAIVKA